MTRSSKYKATKEEMRNFLMIRFEGGLKLHEDLAVNPIVESELHRCGNNEAVRGIAWPVIDAILQGTWFDIVDLIIEEISQARNIEQDMTTHPSYFPKVPAHRHAPPSPPQAVQEEEQVNAVDAGSSSGPAYKA
ncbi:hypothetical protein GUJ93_ZPchr0011g27995 [Zizania palustris]|uniref:Uncharacterized protein n=1 Tax=Zizania palustris TaxID=103762 RepID=A0A8J5WIG6_ZIZPA|nr:hypothetical protein GUJ93_ZPchr0011g27995 [Zizania palustris]